MAPPRSRRDDEAAILDRTWHLSETPREVLLTELEYAAMRMLEAFNRWSAQGLASLGGADVTTPEATILHVVRMQDRPKSLATIARLLNRDDTPNIQYVLRKLGGAGLVSKRRDAARKTFLYEATPRGQELTDAYAVMRRQVLVPMMDAIQGPEERFRSTVEFIQVMTGLYDAAGRVAATYRGTNVPAKVERDRAERRAGRVQKGRGLDEA